MQLYNNMDLDLKQYSNKQLLEMMDNLNKNHEKIKFEMLVFVEMLTQIEKDYILVHDELKSRT